MRPLPITLVREGTFKMSGPATDTKCGPLDATEFRFLARICTTEEHLDTSGWILDATSVWAFFTKDLATRAFVSCELLVLQAVRGLLALAPEAERIDVVLWNGTPNVRFESHWVRPAGAPVPYLLPSPDDAGAAILTGRPF